MTNKFKNGVDTIVAQATPSGQGGVAIVRVSGPMATNVAAHILHKVPKARYAEYLPFYDDQNRLLDQGIALYFLGPNSFTGEDILELQGHGGPVVVNMLIQSICKLEGVRLARPGEFSERAFLNDKLDLTQAEAISDLINASSEQAVRSAMNSLKGLFSEEIHKLVDQLIYLRTYVEAAIDFPDEEVDFLSDGHIERLLADLIEQTKEVQVQANQGILLQEGMKIAIIGLPNAGKSSLLNALSGEETAIVTDIAGTTRDLLKQQINIDGMPLHIIDTAGLRTTDDQIEKIGIQRAWRAIEEADRLLFVVDQNIYGKQTEDQLFSDLLRQLPTESIWHEADRYKKMTMIRNKIDLTQESPKIVESNGYTTIYITAQSEASHLNLGIKLLKDHLKHCIGFQNNTEGQFIARRRHLEAIERALTHLYLGEEQIQVYQAGELLAEELRMAQAFLNSITGAFTADDLLGSIFGSFCIGK